MGFTFISVLYKYGMWDGRFYDTIREGLDHYLEWYYKEEPEELAGLSEASDDDLMDAIFERGEIHPQ